jgi:hypothetical protein
LLRLRVLVMVPRDNAFVLVDNVLVRDAEIRRLASPKLEFRFRVYGFYRGGVGKSGGVI